MEDSMPTAQDRLIVPVPGPTDTAINHGLTAFRVVIANAYPVQELQDQRGVPLPRVLPAHEVAMGILWHPRTAHYQVWLSLSGSDVMWVVAHPTVADTEASLLRLQLAYSAGHFATTNRLLTILHLLRQRGTVPEALPPIVALALFGLIEVRSLCGGGTPL